MAAANPAFIDIPAGTWELAAAGSTQGFIYPQTADAVYYHTYKLAGEAAPDPSPVPGDVDFIGVPLYYRIERIAGENVVVGGVVMAGTVLLDHYVYAHKAAGRVIVHRGT